MHKFAIALAAFAAIGIAVPLTSSERAEEARVVIKTADRDHDGDMQRHHKNKIVIIKHRRHREHDHD